MPSHTSHTSRTGHLPRLTGAVLMVLLTASAALAQRSTSSSSSSSVGRTNAGGGSGSAPPVRAVTSSPPSSSTSGGGSDYDYQPYQRSYGAYDLNRQRRRFLYGYDSYGHGYPANPYGARWTASYLRRLCSKTKPSFVSITTLAAPKTARAAYKKAAKQMNKGKPDMDLAIAHLEEAVSIYPDYAAAWTLLGRVQQRGGDRESAERSLEKAVEIDPKYLGAYGPLASLAVHDERWDDLLWLSGEMLRINPLFTLGHYYKGGALINKGDTGAAEKALREALSTPDAAVFPESHYVLAELYRGQSDVKLAAREYRLYAAAAPPSRTVAQAVQWLQRWETDGVIESKSSKRKRKKSKKAE